MRAVAAVLLAAAAVGAAAAPAPAAGGTWGWVDGVVRRGPTTPVCVVGSPCDAPAAGAHVLVLRNGRVVARPVADAAGRFHVRLRPSRYDFRAVSPAGIGRGSTIRTIRVVAGRHVAVRLSIDTGIR